MFGIDHAYSDSIDDFKRDLLDSPYSTITGTELEDFLEGLINRLIVIHELGKRDESQDKKIDKLAKELGYEWESGGSWKKIKKEK